MIVRKYGRRGRDISTATTTYSGTDSFSDSQEKELCPNDDVYNFSWSDPYAFDSQTSDLGNGFWNNNKSKKLKVVDLGQNSLSQESKEFQFLSISESDKTKSKGKKQVKEFGFLSKFQTGLGKSKDKGKKELNSELGFEKLKDKGIKKVDFDPFEYDCSEEMEKDYDKGGFESKDTSVFDFSEDGDVWQPNKFKNFDSDSYGFNSSQEVDVLKPNKFKNVDSDSCRFNSSQEVDVRKPNKHKNVDSTTFGFNSSQEVDVRKPNKLKNVDSTSFGFNSSQEVDELYCSQSSKFESRRSKKKYKKENGVIRKKGKNNKIKSNAVRNKNRMEVEEIGSDDVVLTTSLMETQEFGEMTEHVDEVEFALDGLKKGQPVGVQRGSLLSLLSICKTAQQRRLIGAHGMAKTIVNAVLGLSLDDPASNIAATALLYILTSDGQDDNLLDSPNCIRFLVRMLSPCSPPVANGKGAHSIGSKLLGISKNTGFSKDSAKGIVDTSSDAIKLKVKEILVNSKEMKLRDENDSGMEEPELNPKWISLLTMEKACLSTISIEDTIGTPRKAGGRFKEKLREFGGLDAVFEVARKCHCVMEEWLQKSPNFAQDLNDSSGLESLIVVLKCLKIMENAAFLSYTNQSHLLVMKGMFDGERTPRSFTKLVLSIIKSLSGASLSSNSLSGKLCNTLNGSSNLGEYSSQKSSDESRNICQNPDQTSVFKSSYEASRDLPSLKLRVESSTAGSCSSISIINISSNDSEPEFVENAQQMEESQDPFAFDADEFEPSKWDLLSGAGRVNKFPSQESRATTSNHKDRSRTVPDLRQHESVSTENRHSHEGSCSSTAVEEKSSLLADCLLTAVKVLMNLTNDNPEGSRQIAACGGLEILASLIAGHFPSCSSTLLQLTDNSLLPKPSSTSDKHSNTRLTDQELDFLVAILGLLVNLVEKDGRNRSRLAAATVSVPIMEGLDVKEERGVIPLFCSIFLSNQIQGTGEAAPNGKELSWEDEEAIIQGEKEAEKMIIEAYAALLLAFLSTESKSIRDAIADCLPEKNLKILVPVMERFVEFHKTLNMISPETHKTVVEVIESCRIS